MLCRGCGHDRLASFVDLGMTPLANAYLSAGQCREAEVFYPLHAHICERCLLVQLDAFEAPQSIFGDYAYFSSYSDTWLAHARTYAEHMRVRLGLGGDDLVVELASNDGYLLRNFVAAGIPVLGIEPAANVAEVARAQGVPTLARFFGLDLARELRAEGHRPRLMVANNVLAHVPDLNDFVAGIAELLADDGVVTIEFPHLLELIRGIQFDTIYHEHFSYFSLCALEPVLERHGLCLVDVDRLATHGGSLRLYLCPARAGAPVSAAVGEVRAAEAAAGLHRLDGYTGFAARVAGVKRSLLRFLLDHLDAGRRVAAYGAPAKGNTLLNFCGIGADIIDFTVDRSPHKQGLFLPGSHVPVLAPEALFERRPDVIVVLPWNLASEIAAQIAGVRAWGAQMVVPLPRVHTLAATAA